MIRLWVGISWCLFCCAITGCSQERTHAETRDSNTKPRTAAINGVSFEGPPKVIDAVRQFAHIPEATKANFIAVLPYGFLQKEQPRLVYNSDRQWWGEKVIGIRAQIKAAKINNLKVMVKPQVWVGGQGWAGEFKLNNEADWTTWEENYTEFILTYARLAEEEQADLFCIGTEFRLCVRNRPDYWPKLIEAVRAVYSGAITYAANWDNYDQVAFWGALDYIGVDVYFPLVHSPTPSVDTLRQAWQEPKAAMLKLQQRYNKPLLFTEFGYKSMDYGAGRQWEIEHDYDVSKVNMQVQQNAYQAIFEEFWGEEWFAGGFLWKWFRDDEKRGGVNNVDFTPQNKPVELIIQQWYGAN